MTERELEELDKTLARAQYRLPLWLLFGVLGLIASIVVEKYRG